MDTPPLRFFAATAMVLAMGCQSDRHPSASPAQTSPSSVVSAASAPDGPRPSASVSASAAPANALPPRIDRTSYPWLAASNAQTPQAVESLDFRLHPPQGFRRQALPPESFGAWLRRLPLAAPGTPVLSHTGETILAGNDDHLAAVVAIDWGKADLQQCADSIIRMHAEWQWADGLRDMSYAAAAGPEMPFAKWVQGQRPVPKGASLVWETKAPGKADYDSFRKYLDSVFMFANTGSIAKQAKSVPLTDLTPGDFFVLPGNPGHAMLVLDMAVSTEGQKAVLLGQGYMPAQSYHVIRPNKNDTWFVIDPASPGIRTAFWPRPFVWSSLRRWPPTSPTPASSTSAR